MLLNYIEKGAGPPLVLLHGIAGSARYWESIMPILAKTHRVIAIDLLGFGYSPHPKNSDYTYQAHIKSIQSTLESAGVDQPIILIGHSMGALLALRYAAEHPENIQSLIVVSLPIYKDRAQAKKDITKSKKRLELAYYGPTSHFLCTAWCRGLRPISSKLAHLFLPAFPRHVAEDSVLHSWRSYALSLHNLIENQTVVADMKKLRVPAQLVYGADESKVVLGNIAIIRDLSSSIKIKVFPGSHHLPLESPEAIAHLIVDSSQHSC